MTNLQRLLGGDPIDISQPETQRSLYMEIQKKLEVPSSASEAVAGILKWEETTGKEPEIPGITKDVPPRTLGMEIRNGEILPSQEASDLYQGLSGKPLPGQGDKSEQEINRQDLWDGFRGSNFQSGKTPKSQDIMGLNILGGKAPESHGTQQDMTWGPSKMIKGALSGNFEEMEKGAKECMGIGMFNKTLEAFSDVFERSGPASMLQKLTGPEGTLGGIKKEQEQLLNTVTDALTGNGRGEQFKKIGEILEKGNKDMLQALLPGGPGKKEKGEPQEEKKDTPKQAADDFFQKFAGLVASNATYKMARKKGFGPKQAGEMGEVAGEEAESIAKTQAPEKNQGQFEDKLMATAKAAKHLTATVLSKAALAIPGIGKAISIGITVADKATDILMDMAKSGATEQPQSGPDAPKEGDPKNETPGESKDGENPTNTFKTFMKKGKKGLLKELLPGGDVLADAAGSAATGIKSGVQQGMERKKTDEVHLSIDGIQ